MGKLEDSATLVPNEHLPLLAKAAPSTTYLSQQEVAEQGSAAPWPGLRKALISLLGGLFACMLLLAVALLFSLPRPHPPLGWWQKAAFYHLPPSCFPDSDGDGWGDLAGVRQQLDQLATLPIQALVLGPILEGGGANLTQIIPAHGSLAQLQALLTDGRKRGIRILLELPPWGEEGDASAESNQTVQLLKEALQFWQSEGVHGFLVDKDPAWCLLTVLKAWDALDDRRQRDPRDERALIVWDRSETCGASEGMPSRVILTCQLPGTQRNLSAQALLQLAHGSLQLPGTPWPSWAVPRGLSPVGGWGEILGVLLFTLPGVPLVQGGPRSPLPLEFELMEGKPSRPPLAALYQSLLELHAKSFSLQDTDFTPLPLPSHVEDLVAFLRPGACSSLLVILNLGPQPAQLSLKELSFSGQAKVVLSTHAKPQKEASVEMVRLVPQQALLLKVPQGYQP
ncbi:4F2 cell-surface antigen heavy chain-like [Ahaetulla prasina]|uniref:4F2 cell-surface antigen heavy chain-like n=1 Tax=Ahaetulla prasina TaxID=499056 RepID=UPI0026482E50|nr:4F2 cell-surface antigen heavy chain-like [Ahaetulla prasina]XP_058052310.1 4F2 cell-surface antigen heavy chain-like [Ahaetulla prasina]XP_058052311.1 4F2 cell-surface antigen heavy chain-like [Ahaetulla prasina]XP_058052312.1 4F2 cell-surface antigen heavy chain-like [Ahaetulla prasina]XP_058052313.1 4F2 cell-surface antigen heavy chain-like [Ahaetulla prasina]